jgi:Asp-tRNA(Asn)/Glu-tRNA(Gln) amidotransferase C subunit
MGGEGMTLMPFRPDQVTDGQCVDKILENAPEVTCNMFVVPKVVE